MSKISNLTLVLFVALLFCESSLATSRLASYIVAGSIATAGAVILGMGGMLTKFALDDDGVISSRYGTTTMSIQNYTVDPIDCVTHSGKTSHHHPYTATCQNVYHVQNGNLSETYNVAYGQVCGDSVEDALTNVRATYPIGNWGQFITFTLITQLGVFAFPRAICGTAPFHFIVLVA